jgi:hypothetical protein
VVEAVSSSQTSVSYCTELRSIPEDSHLHVRLLFNEQVSESLFMGDDFMEHRHVPF